MLFYCTHVLHIGQYGVLTSIPSSVWIWGTCAIPFIVGFAKTRIDILQCCNLSVQKGTLSSCIWCFVSRCHSTSWSLSSAIGQSDKQSRLHLFFESFQKWKGWYRSTLERVLSFHIFLVFLNEMHYKKRFWGDCVSNGYPNCPVLYMQETCRWKTLEVTLPNNWRNLRNLGT